MIRMMVANSRKKSPVTYSEISLFFSLVDYRNNYFTSNDPNKIIEFYNGFDNREQLIQWMRERPKGGANIFEVEGNRDIIVVVIPTADFNGKYAKECRENIFKGLHMVFVESGEVPDPYFNYAYNCNVGIKKAMEYNPKWVVVSNDDMVKVDDISKLINELQKIDNENIDTVFTPPSQYHSTPMFLCKPKVLLFIALRTLTFFSKQFSYIEKIYYQLRRFNKKLYSPRDEYCPTLMYKIISFIFFKRIENFINTLSFGIFSAYFVKKSNNNVFDDIYINEMEDTDLSICIKRRQHNTAIVDYKIGEYVGSSLGRGSIRTMRLVPGWTYFSYKMENDDFDQ
ncbi:MAG: hypothetical protein M1431_06420 [Candidatus Thermoplasmatota archaeon]|nr:hypothetical protein [Candidatus Thermoplasmatota archaeon]